MSSTKLPHPTLHRSWVEIDLQAVVDNLRFFRRFIGPKPLLMPAVKADAYGHGAVPIAKAAIAGGANRLAVATALEGQTLREAGIGLPIQILGATLPEEVNLAVRYNLILSVHDLYIARLAALAAHRENRAVPIHLKIDSGMGRLGILPENAVAAAAEIAAYPGIHLEGVFMHFADPADISYSRWQIDEFNRACRDLEQAGVKSFLRHASSSGAILLHPDAHFDMVRPGCGMYGYLSPGWLGQEHRLAPVMAWKSTVIQIKDYPPGRNLGYSRTYTTRRPTRVAVLPVGYADGFRREFSNRGYVLVRGHRAPVVGMVSMDYSIVDVTEIPDLEVGATATLLGSDQGSIINAEEMAEWGKTIPYCLTTGIGNRVGRYYQPESF